MLTNQCQVGQRLRIPINHFEGNYVCDAETLAELRAEDRVRRALRREPQRQPRRHRRHLQRRPQRRRPDAAPERGLATRSWARPTASSAAALAARCRCACRGCERPTVHASATPTLARERLGDRRRHVRTRRRARLLGDLPPTAAGTSSTSAAARVHDRGVARRVPDSRRSRASTRRRAMVDDACTRVPERGFATCRRDAAAAAAGRRRVLAVAARTPAATRRRRWRCGLRRCVRAAGCSSCEEPVRYRSDDPYFQRYEEAVTTIVDRDRRDALGVDLASTRSARLRARARPRRRASGSGLHAPPRCSGATRCSGENVCPTRDRADRALSDARTARRRDDRDVGAAPGGVQEAARVMPAFFKTSGGTPNSRHAP